MAKQKTVLITRPQEDALPLAALLEVEGYGVIVAPMMRVRFLEAALPKTRPQAVLITSANGARALAAATAERSVPLITVGEASAEAARQLGFQDVAMADPKLGGDAAGLAAYAAQHCRPETGPLLHVCGTSTAGDLSAQLERRGFTVHCAILYEATPVEGLPEAAFSANYALFYSPRTARIFLELAKKHPLGSVVALCLSRNIAAGLSGAGFARVLAAKTPTQAALLALLREQA